MKKIAVFSITSLCLTIAIVAANFLVKPSIVQAQTSGSTAVGYYVVYNDFGPNTIIPLYNYSSSQSLQYPITNVTVGYSSSGAALGAATVNFTCSDNSVFSISYTGTTPVNLSAANTKCIIPYNPSTGSGPYFALKSYSTVTDTTPKNTDPFYLTSVSPNAAKVGDSITFHGSGFDYSNNTVVFGCGTVPQVYINGVPSNGSALTVAVPNISPNSCQVAIWLPDRTTGHYASGGVPFSVISGVPPVLTSVIPSSAKVGQTIAINGSGFAPINNEIVIRNSNGMIISDMSNLTSPGSSVSVKLPSNIPTGVYSVREESDYYSGPSNTITFSIKSPAPTKLTAQIYGGGVILKWQNNSSYVERFEVERTDSTRSKFVPLYTVDKSKIQGVNVGDIDYYITNAAFTASQVDYRVRAVQNTGDYYTDYSNVATVSLIPNAPTKLTVQYNSPSLLLKWNYVLKGPIDKIEVYRAYPDVTPISEDAWTHIADIGEVPGGTIINSFTDTLVDSFHGPDVNVNNYYYRVRACLTKWNACSDYSNIEDYNLNAPMASVTRVSASKATVRWKFSETDADGFKVERRLGFNGQRSIIATLGKTVRVYNDVPIQGNLNYYDVYAYNAITKSDPSLDGSTGAAKTYVDITPPSVPNLSLSTFFIYNKNPKVAPIPIVKTSWMESNDDDDNYSDHTNVARGYNLYRFSPTGAKTKIGSFLRPNLLNGNILEYNDAAGNTLKAGSTYCYTASAYDLSKNTSAESAKQCITIPLVTTTSSLKTSVPQILVADPSADVVDTDTSILADSSSVSVSTTQATITPASTPTTVAAPASTNVSSPSAQTTTVTTNTNTSANPLASTTAVIPTTPIQSSTAVLSIATSSSALTLSVASNISNIQSVTFHVATGEMFSGDIVRTTNTPPWSVSLPTNSFGGIIAPQSQQLSVYAYVQPSGLGQPQVKTNTLTVTLRKGIPMEVSLNYVSVTASVIDAILGLFWPIQF